MSSGIKHVIWDWNGTLINDGELCVSIVNELLLELSIPSVSLQFYRENFSISRSILLRKNRFSEG